MSEQQQDLVCQECGKTFTFTQADASYFERRGWPMPPTRCRGCRTQAKPPQTSGPRADSQPQYATGDPNEYRSPMAGGLGAAPRVRDMRPRRPAPAPTTDDDAADDGQDIWVTDPTAVGDPNEYRSPMQVEAPGGIRGPSRRRFARRPDRNDEARAHAYRRQVVGDTNEYRSPMAGQFHGQDAVSGPFARSPEQPAATNRNGNVQSPARPDRFRAASGERARGPRRARPMFDAICAKCGAKAQVPFEPTEGREVFCTSCFAERRAAERPRTPEGEG